MYQPTASLHHREWRVPLFSLSLSVLLTLPYDGSQCSTVQAFSLYRFRSHSMEPFSMNKTLLLGRQWDCGTSSLRRTGQGSFQIPYGLLRRTQHDPGANVTSIPDIAIHILLRPSLAVCPCDLNVRLHSIDHCCLPDADDATVGNEETFTIAVIPKHSYPRTCSQSEANDTSVNTVDLPASRAIRATRHWQCVHCMPSP